MSVISTLVQAASSDSSFAFLSDPYRFISRRASTAGCDMFETRLLLRPVICMVGSEAAALFYDEDRFERRGAAPEPVAATLFGRGGVQQLDGVDHRARKGFFVDLLDAEALSALSHGVIAHWMAALQGSGSEARLPLYATAQHVLAQAVFEWSGATPDTGDLSRRARQLASLFDDAARGLIPHLRARMARIDLENWLSRRIDALRAGEIELPVECALARIAAWLDADGRPLASRVAAVELLNVLRPVVAVSVYVVLAAHAVLTHPPLAAQLQGAPPALLHHFINEVRRYYPFFPALAARVRRPFEWRGIQFVAGCRTLLEIYGTHHDPRVWEHPEQFNPARFASGNPPAFAFLPQGSGDVLQHHRCPGEDTVLALASTSLGFLLQHTALQRDGRDARIDFGRMPALPRAPIWFVRRDAA